MTTFCSQCGEPIKVPEDWSPVWKVICADCSMDFMWKIMPELGLQVPIIVEPGSWN